jgi:DNA-binding response OmpR family regulator
MKILLVEDEPDVAVPIALALNNLGHETAVAISSLKAIESLDVQAPDLVITDLNLPDGNGFEVTRSVRQRLPLTPVIITTAYDELEEASREAGAAVYLRKPFTIAALMSAIDAALKSRSLQL